MRARRPLVLDNMEAEALRAPGRPELTPVLAVNEQRLQVLEPTQWNVTGPRRPPSQVSRFQGAMERSASVLPR